MPFSTIWSITALIWKEGGCAKPINRTSELPVPTCLPKLFRKDTMMDLGKDRGLIPLTRTELSCLRQCAKGLSDQEIGCELELTAGEVASVLSVVMLKLRAPNRMAGLAKAARLGMLGTATP
jgi:DNA-binding NarL/FixJ family response regulator